jgi:thiamine-monophosphate kinase
VNQDELVRWIRGQLGPSRNVLIDVGDDAALVQLAGRDAVLKVDNVIEGIHVAPGTPLPLVGHKAMARPLSDFAAMAAIPRFALISWALPRRLRPSQAKQLFRGMVSTAKEFHVRIVGGDLTVHDGPLMVSVTIAGSPGPTPPVLRSGARPGHRLCVTGPLGGAALGKHLTFTPRVFDALALAKTGRVSGMIDISDGLLVDLQRMCEASGAGANLIERLIPVSKQAVQLSRRDRRPAVEHAMNDGEDYELLLAITDPTLPHTFKLLRMIGEFTERPGIRMLTRAGEFVPVKPRGWVYRIGGRPRRE